MPSSPALAHSGFGVIAAILLLALLASGATLIASTLLVWRYRRKVDRLMSMRAGALSARDAGVRTMGHPSDDTGKHAADPFLSVGCQGDRAGRLFRRMLEDSRRHACKYALAGSSFALVVAVGAFAAFSQIQVNYLAAASHPLQLVFLFWTFSWPVVLTINIVAARSWRNRWRNVAVYFAVLAVLGALVALTPTEAPFRAGEIVLPAWHGESPLRLAMKWSTFNAFPTLLVLVFRHNRIRAIAPMVLSFMTVVCAGVLAVIAAAFLYQTASLQVISAAIDSLGMSTVAATAGYLLLLCALAVTVSTVLGWLLLVWIRRRYQRKKASDQSLAIDALWLIFVTFYTVVLSSAGPGWALVAMAAFLLFELVVWAGDRILRLKRVADPATLLVLRVFALGRRSEALFDILARRWRYVGHVNLIAAADLALSTIAPHRFLAFISGRLDRVFIRDEASLTHAVAGMDRECDADGRFRINDFFCHADTWQGALAVLIGRTDVVLMDLRGLSAGNVGCVYEIRQLVNTVPVERLVFVVDVSTDHPFLQQTWGNACLDLPAGSPNSGRPDLAPRLFELDSPAPQAIDDLLLRMCVAAGTGPLGATTR
uniref:Uncharacterized protein n=1 Tax=uncultured bacterium 888 TaxID=548896 RepID=B8R8Q5_9BACT|nr:hypothetical protein [uncultured bacterium 888]